LPLARLLKATDASGEALASNMDLEAGVDTIKRNMKSASFAKGSYSSMVKRNPILATFMVDREGQYCLRAMHKGCSFFGAFLIILGLVAGLVLMPMAFSNAKLNMLMVKPSDPCFEEGLCPDPLKVNIFMFNITNPEEYMAGAQPPNQEELGPFVFEIGQRNYNASFSDDLAEVDYTSAMFATYLPEESCSSCKDDSVIVGPNLGYLAVLHQAGGSEMGLLLQSAPAALAQVMQGLKAAMEVEAPGASAADQWATCAPLAGQSIITTPSGAALGPHFPEFCAWGRHVAQRTPEELEIPRDVAEDFITQASAPGSTVPLVLAMSTPEQASAATGWEAAHCTLLAGYAQYIATTYAQAGLQTTLGPFLGRDSGGPLVAKNVSQWVDGWDDPLLAMVLGADDPMVKQTIAPGLKPGQRFETTLLHNETREAMEVSSPFVNRVHAYTGKGRPDMLGELISFNGETSKMWSSGSEPIRGNLLEDASTGNRYGQSIKDSPRLTSWSLLLQRSIPWQYDRQGELKGLPTYDYSPASDFFSFCQGANLPACNSGISGALDLTELYGQPMLVTLPHLTNADPRIAQSAGKSPVADSLAKWRYRVLPDVGIPGKMEVPMQYNALLHPTHLYPDVWNEFPLEGGSWVGFYRLDLPFELDDDIVHQIKQGLFMSDVIQIGSSVGLPLLGLLILLYCVYNTFYAEQTVESKKLSREALSSRSPSFAMPSSNSPKDMRRRSSLMQYSFSKSKPGILPEGDEELDGWK